MAAAEAVQLLIESRVMGIDDMVASAIGGAVGVWLGERRRTKRADRHDSQRRVRLAKGIVPGIPLMLMIGYAAWLHCHRDWASADGLGPRVETFVLRSWLPLGGDDWLLLTELFAAGVVAGAVGVAIRALQIRWVGRPIGGTFRIAAAVGTMGAGCQLWKTIHEGSPGTMAEVLVSIGAAAVVDRWVGRAIDRHR